MVDRLRNKIALVTGAGSPVGRACAVAFLREGARVFAVDGNAKALKRTFARLKEIDAEPRGLVADLTDETSVQKAVAACVAAFETIDIVFNGIEAPAAGGPVEMSEADWDAAIAINVTSVFLTCKYVLPHMVARKAGAIVNLSSLAARVYTGEPALGFAASKAALESLTQAVALEYAAAGVRCNSIIAGPLGAETVGKSDGDWETPSDVVPLGFLGSARDIADAAVFLASDDAGFITGAHLPVDGGMLNTILPTPIAGRSDL